MLNQAKTRNREAINRDRVRLVQGDLGSLVELPLNFDKVFSVNLVQFLGNRLEAFRALYRATAPGGLVATTYQPRHAKATREDALRMAGAIESAMTQAGFTGIRREELALVPVPVVCVLGSRRL